MSLHTSKTENMSANLFRRAKTPSASNIPEKLPSLVGKIASWCRSFHDSKKKEFENNQCRRSYTQNAHLCPEGSLYTEHYGGMMRHEQSDGSSSENSLVASSISSRSLSFRTVDDAQEEEDDDDSKEDNNNICPSGLQEENREGNRSSWTLVTYLRATKLKITQELSLGDGAVSIFTVATARRSNGENPSNRGINASVNSKRRRKEDIMTKASSIYFVRAIEDEGMDTHKLKREGNQQAQVYHLTE
ncbi:hypothetical protein BGZ58_010197 [Dissophora ornata]|nr:hypothetical protein BGZ58_010197 [Dissophora ornata]